MKRLAVTIGSAFAALALTCSAAAAQEAPTVSVYFNHDDDAITPAAAEVLDMAVDHYRGLGSAQVVLSGHTSRAGAAEYNVGLSQRRANAVRDYLASARVPSGVITTMAFGESRPAVETKDGVREPANDRVEIEFGPGSGW